MPRRRNSTTRVDRGLVFVLFAQLGACGAPQAPEATAPAATAPTTPIAAPAYVGAAACTECHAEAAKAWRGSHHDLAMQKADAQAVLGDFNDATLAHKGIASRFFRRDGKFIVTTDGADGKPADFEIAYTFGVWPLQQYLVAFPGGRYQALNLAWDSRGKAEGGQRWFDLQAGQKLGPNDALHWTGRYQNWALQCAECHSTRLEKHYDAGSDSYKTTFAEINVACEACHGPGSRHVESARRKDKGKDGDDGLVVKLESRWNEAWRLPDADAMFATRDRRAPAQVMNVCAACHASRSTLAEGGASGDPLEQTHRPALLTPPLYYPDGQQRDEVYVWASFAQTKMAAAGVTCMDCHDAHSLKLRAEGNALCLRCHNPALFERPEHHHHKAGSVGAQCVECHMPERNYMVIDARRDHAIRVPRPDLSDALGTPDACTRCHKERKPAWAAAAMDRWYGGSKWRERTEYGSTLHSAATAGSTAVLKLLPLARNDQAPAIVRATALALAAPAMRPSLLANVALLLSDPDPSMRIAALGAFESAPPELRARTAALLGDPIRGVRLEAARILADLPDEALPADAREARARALDESFEALRLNADWPGSSLNLGNLQLKLQRPDEARTSFERALALDPLLPEAYVNLADLHRQQGNEAESERVLRQGLALLPDGADLHHALGLLLVRRGEHAAAQAELAAAAKLAPDNARYAYVHAIALDADGAHGPAIRALLAADARHPYDIDILGALVSMQRDSGQNPAALASARKLAEALPEDAGVRKLLEELERAR
jgi:predicted CXXCH cytochrome family protein